MPSKFLWFFLGTFYSDRTLKAFGRSTRVLNTWLKFKHFEQESTRPLCVSVHILPYPPIHLLKNSNRRKILRIKSSQFILNRMRNQTLDPLVRRNFICIIFIPESSKSKKTTYLLFRLTTATTTTCTSPRPTNTFFLLAVIAQHD